MRIIENTKNAKLYILDEHNNLEDKPTEFFNFIGVLCKKYKMKIYKIAKNHTNDRNLGVQLLSIDGYTYIFYNYNKRILELELKGIYSERIEKDILKYSKTYKYLKGDEILDDFGIRYTIDENIDCSNVSKKIMVKNKETGVNCTIYNCSVVPYID